MPAATCSTLYYTIFALFAVAFLLLLLKQNRGAAAALISGALISGASVVSIVVTARRLPLSGAYESIVYILFVLSTLALLSNRSAAESILKYRTGVWTGSVMLVLLTLHIPSPKELNHDFFMYGNLWVNLFFNLRLLAAAFFVHAAVLFNVVAWTRPADDPAGSAISRGPTPGLPMPRADVRECPAAAGGFSRCMQNKTLYRARNFLLTGVVIYLAGEWSGSLWCLNWLGDTWRWSGGFFKSAVVFLLVMAGFHLPPAFAKSMRIRAVIGSGPAVFILWMIFYH